jgi:hypothetical protein
MARVCSTAKVEREGDETEATETVPISEAMRRSGLVTSEDTPVAEAKQADVEEDESEDEYGAVPSKPRRQKGADSLRGTGNYLETRKR